jgi:hypothetical protein
VGQSIWHSRGRRREEVLRVPHFTLQLRGSLANVGFVGLVLFLKPDFGLRSGTSSSVLQQAHFDKSPGGSWVRAL